MSFTLAFKPTFDNYCLEIKCELIIKKAGTLDLGLFGKHVLITLIKVLLMIHIQISFSR